MQTGDSTAEREPLLPPPPSFADFPEDDLKKTEETDAASQVSSTASDVHISSRASILEEQAAYMNDYTWSGYWGMIKWTSHLALLSGSQFGWAVQSLLFLSILMPHQIDQMVPENKRGTTLGVVMLVGSIISILAPPFIGIYSDRYQSKFGRRRPFIFVGSIINAGGLVGIAFVENVASLIALYLVIVLGSNITSTAFNATVPDFVAKEHWGVSSGILGALMVLGIMVGTALGATVSAIGVVWCYVILALITLASNFVTLLTFKEPSSMGLESEELALGRIIVKMFQPLFLVHDFRWVFIIRFFIQMGVYTVQEFMEFWVKDVIPTEGMNVTTETALLFLPVGVTAMISAIVVGILSDKMEGKRKLFLISSCTALAFVSALAGAVQSFQGALVLFSVFGLALGVFLALDYALICDVLPSKQNFARDLGVWHISVVLPQMIASPVAGVLLDSVVNTGSSESKHMGYVILFLLTAVYFISAAALFTKLQTVK